MIAGECVLRAGEELIRLTRKPAENTEKCGQDINNEDGTDKFPRGPRLSTTSDENKPILNQ